MQTIDSDFINRYKRKQFEMSQKAAPVVAPVAVPVVVPVAAPVVVQKAAKEAPKEAPKVVVQEAVPVVVQETPKEVVQEIVQEIVQETLQLVNNFDTDANPLQLIKSALEQINYALRLLDVRVKKAPIIAETIGVPETPIVAETVAKTIVPETPIVAETVAKTIVPETPIQPTSPSSADLVSNDYISDVDVDEQEKKEEFKIVMPKKSRNKKLVVSTVLPVKEKSKKDVFPSLVSSFMPVIPVKNTGFWGGEEKKSLAIARAIAHLPSPSPISSPSPNLKKSIRTMREEERRSSNFFSEDENDEQEYNIQKCDSDYDE